MDDDLPVHVGHYLRDRDLEGGQGVMKLFGMLTSLSNMLHMKESKGSQSGELGGQISFDQ